MALPQERAAASTAAIAIASAIVSGVFGYFLGQFSTLSTVKSPEREQVSDSESEDEDETSPSAEQELGSFSDSKEECKLVLVVRTDLGMTKGAYTQSPTLHATAIVLTIHAKQAKSLRSAPTRPWPATRRFSAAILAPRYCAGGNDMARPRSPCR